jgi:hypothetical protein
MIRKLKKTPERQKKTEGGKWRERRRGKDTDEERKEELRKREEGNC